MICSTVALSISMLGSIYPSATLPQQSSWKCWNLLEQAKGVKAYEEWCWNLYHWNL